MELVDLDCRHPGGRPDGREAPRPRHTRLRACGSRRRDRDRGPGHDGRARRGATGDRDRLDRRLPAANAAFANAMLCHGLDFDDTHSESVSHVSTVISPAALAAAEQAGAGGGRYARRNRRRQRGRLPDRDGGAGQPSTHGASIPPRSAACSAASRRSAGSRALTPRRRRARSESRGRSRAACSPISRTGHRRSRCTRPGRHMAPTWLRGSPRTGRLGRRRYSRGNSGSTTHFSAPRTARSTSPPSSPISASRWETPRIAYKPFPVCHFMHGSLGATAEAAAGGRSRRRDRGRARLRPGSGRVARARACRPEARRRVRSTKASSRCSTRWRRCSCAATSPSPTSPTRRSPTRPCSPWRQQVRYETRQYPTYPQAFPGGVVVRLSDGTSFEGDYAYQKGGPENPSRPSKYGRSSAETPHSRCRIAP